jgi:hypothetical protein
MAVINAERFYFADFTLDNYRRLLKLAREKYNFRSYQDFSPDERFLIWRHDVDFSPQAAREMAGIEAAEGLKTTYFVLLHSEFYNLLEKVESNCVHEILRMGHYLGLHFDCHYYEINHEEELKALLLREKRILEETFGASIRTFSFHNPTPAILNYNRGQYAGLTNTYSEYFRNQVGYCSDSNGCWQFRRLEDVLREGKDERLQVLTHPEMWPEAVMSPRQRIYRCLDERAARAKEYYDQMLLEAQRENIDWE